MRQRRDWRTSALVVAHSGLLALGCGITERHVEERADVVETAGTPGTVAESGRTSGSSGNAAGGAGGAGGRNATGAVAGNDDVTNGAGVELDPVGVGEPPTVPCSCGSGCTVEQCDVSTLAQPGQFLMNVFVRDGWLYWMTEEALGRARPEGGLGSGIASGLRLPSRVVVDARFAYFSSYQGLWQVQRDAVAVPLIGAGNGTATLLATLSPWERRLTEITVDSRDLYWTAPGTKLGPAQLQRTPVLGGTSVTLARLPNDEDWPLGLAVDDTDVYFTSNAALQRISKAGGSVERLELVGAQVAYDAPHPMLGIALDQRFVYFDGGRTLRRRAKGGINSVSLFNVPEGDELRGIVLDRAYAYFGTKSGNIMRVPKVGGEPSVMVSGEQNPLVTAVDATSVYWVEQEAGRIRRATK